MKVFRARLTVDDGFSILSSRKACVVRFGKEPAEMLNWNLVPSWIIQLTIRFEWKSFVRRRDMNHFKCEDFFGRDRRSSRECQNFQFVPECAWEDPAGERQQHPQLLWSIKIWQRFVLMVISSICSGSFSTFLETFPCSMGFALPAARTPLQGSQ